MLAGNNGVQRVQHAVHEIGHNLIAAGLAFGNDTSFIAFPNVTPGAPWVGCTVLVLAEYAVKGIYNAYNLANHREALQGDHSRRYCGAHVISLQNTGHHTQIGKRIAKR